MNVTGLEEYPLAAAEVDRGLSLNTSRWPNSVFLVVIFVAASAVILPMAFLGIPDGFDLMQHMRFAAAYHDAFVSGSMSPEWAANDNFGFGSIGIRYYPPLAYYILALTKMITGSWYHSFWLTSLAWMFLGSVGVYLWVKEWTENVRATLAAVVYLLVPYHTFQIYQAVLYAELAAAGIVPFCFLFLTRICRRSRWIDALLFSVAYSSLILTHIPSTLIASLALLVYGLLIIEWRRFKDTALKIGAALLLSLLATSFYLSKLVTEIDWVMHNSPRYFANGYYDYKRYLFPIYFSSTATRYVEKLLWHLDIVVILTILLFLPLLLIFLLRKKTTEPEKQRPNFNRSIILTGVFAFFMLSLLSSPVWDAVPVLQKIQFPWRWLLVFSLLGSIAFSVAVPTLLFTPGRNKRLIGYPLVLFMLLIVFFDISQNIIPSTPLAQDIFEQKVKGMNDDEGCDCWWPIWAKREAFDNTKQADTGMRGASVEEWTSRSRAFSVPAGQPGDLRVATFFHPYWKSTVNGIAVPVQHDDNGAILIPLPTEAAEVHLYFQEPPYLSAAKIISFLAWAVLAILLVLSYGDKRYKKLTNLRPEYANLP